MSAARKIKEPSVKDIEGMYYLTINEICKRTTYDRTTIQGFIRNGTLKTEKKNGGKRVVKVSDFLQWWDNLNT
jgi:excisionase family DNA binding protein